MKITIESAVELSPAQITSLKKKLSQLFKSREIEVETIVDPEIIGGLRISSTQQVIDMSLKARLNTLKESLFQK